MTAGLISEVVMIREGAQTATVDLRQSHGTGETAANSAASYSSFFPAALSAALEAKMAALGRPVVQSISTDVVADVVLGLLSGDAVALQLKHGLARQQLGLVRSFLQRVLELSADTDARRQEEAITRLADVLLPDDLANVRGPLAEDNLALRRRFAEQVGLISSSEVAELAGGRASNSYAMASRWRSAGRVFSVNWNGREMFPAFQFRDGRPHPAVKRVLGVLPRSMSGWQVAFWFVTANGWLDDREPVELLDDPDALVGAARREADETVG